MKPLSEVVPGLSFAIQRAIQAVWRYNFALRSLQPSLHFASLERQINIFSLHLALYLELNITYLWIKSEALQSTLFWKVPILNQISSIYFC